MRQILIVIILVYGFKETGDYSYGYLSNICKEIESNAVSGDGENFSFTFYFQDNSGGHDIKQYPKPLEEPERQFMGKQLTYGACGVGPRGDCFKGIYVTEYFFWMILEGPYAFVDEDGPVTETCDCMTVVF